MDVLKAGEAFAGAVVSTANSIPFLGVVVSVIGQVEVMRENKTSSESLADLMQTMCISVKNTLLCIKSDEIFMVRAITSPSPYYLIINSVFGI